MSVCGMFLSGPGRPEPILRAGSRGMEQDQRGGGRPAGDPSAETDAASGKRDSQGASGLEKRQRLPFGAGILPQESSVTSETPKTAPEAGSTRAPEETAPEKPVRESPTSETVPAPEPVASDEAVRPQEGAADSSAEAEAKVEADAGASGEAEEAPETDEDIPDYKIVDPPDEPEEDDFDNIPPGPMQEVRFDDGFPPRRRFARPRKRGGPQRRREPRPSPARARARAPRAVKPVLVIALIVLAVVLAAIAAIVLF